MYDIRAKHPNYVEFEDSWRLMRDAIGGEDDVKERGTCYLPMKTGHAVLPDRERGTAYAAYQLRAEFPEIVSPTITGQVGLICSQAPTVVLPPQFEGLVEQATPDGLTLEDLFARAVVELLSVGRYGILPNFNGRGEPVLIGYTAEQIINWDTTDLALSYVVLDETRQIRNAATNQWQEVERFLELKLEDGIFKALRWEGELMAPVEEQVAGMARTNRSALDIMPFVLMGTRDLSIEPDDVPLYGLARIAVRMYRMDADYQQSLHMTSEPTPYVTGFANPKQAIEDGEAPTTIGAHNLWVLPEGAQAGFLEFSGAGLTAQRAALDAAKESASAFGARMFDETNRAPESGESRKMRYGYTSASLKTIAGVAAAGIERAIRNLARWQSINPDTVSITPNLDWVTDQMTPQELDSLVKTWQAGALSYEMLFERMQAGKLMPVQRTVEEETKAILDDPLRDAVDVDENDPEAGLVPPRQQPATPAP